ncbi:Urease accessory protein UreD [Thalassocella blandensis]|nr:Urease accessory protein UreD [Thalassocella blandensis]
MVKTISEYMSTTSALPTTISKSSFESSDAITSEASSQRREWLAKLQLEFYAREHKTVLRRVEHVGPLRVQKPFYPESRGCCHVYLLHPPGGMVVGDSLKIQASLHPNCHALLTTPSAGKLYGAKHLKEKQHQTVVFEVAANSCIEWLPQETIVFDGANGELNTRLNVQPSGKFFVWDILRLGRAASADHFVSGQCKQALEVWCNGMPVFIERNYVKASSEFSRAHWGLQNANTSATLCASLVASRDQIDQWLEYLQQHCGDGMWGLTQKQLASAPGEAASQIDRPPIFVARYLGHSILDCRRGFEFLWQQSRPLLNQCEAVAPRIWRT